MTTAQSTPETYEAWLQGRLACLSGRSAVIFGAGYVGGEVARLLCGAGVHVTSLVRNPERARQLAGQGVRVVCADLLSRTWMTEVGAGADLVLSAIGSGGGGAEAYRRTYVGGMEAILDWAGAGRVGTLVYTSSTSVYPQDGGVLVDETQPVGGQRETARALVEAENLLLGARGSGVGRRFVLRSGGIYGPGRHAWLDRLEAGETLLDGDGEGHVNLVHRDDLCGAILAAFAAPAGVEGAVCNAVDDGRARRREIVAWLAGRLGRAAPGFSGRAGPRGANDRIILNDRCKTLLGWRLRHPTFREGYAPLLAAAIAHRGQSPH